MTSGSDEDTLTTYAYDANDRLTVEVKDNAGDDTKDRYTEYSYNLTTQTSKTTWQGTSRDSNGAENPLVSSTAYTYNELGRLAQVEETTVVEGVSQTTTTQYEYNTQGLRVTETVTDANDQTTTKEYLFDTMNPTGYAQVLEEYIVDVAGRTLARSYTLGHDVIAQSTAAGIPASADGTVFAETTTHHLLTDGHGSTRLLANLTATTVALAQQYLYNAYGEMLSSEHLAIATNALTTLLYSGEWTNANGTQYLRARFYDPATGRFNRLDPFAGNQNDPQSLHKYLYTHGNPVMGIDPSGNMTINQQLGVAGIITSISSYLGSASFGALGGSRAKGAIVGAQFGVAVSLALFSPHVSMPKVLFSGFVSAVLDYWLQWIENPNGNLNDMYIAVITGFSEGMFDEAIDPFSFDGIINNLFEGVFTVMGRNILYETVIAGSGGNAELNGFKEFVPLFVESLVPSLFKMVKLKGRLGKRVERLVDKMIKNGAILPSAGASWGAVIAPEAKAFAKVFVDNIVPVAGRLMETLGDQFGYLLDSNTRRR